MTYTTPVRDIRFALDHMAGFPSLTRGGAFADLSGDLVSAILQEMAKFCDGVVAPLNAESDRTGATLENGVVRTPPGFKNAYAQYVAGGWGGLSAPEEWGGQGLPAALAVALVDAMNGACMSFAIGATLTTSAIKALSHAGTEEQKRLYLPKFVTGEWTAAMALTEPQAGSDLSAIRARAEPVGDGRYKIRAQKIFITYGDHDMTDNVVHLVLARLPDAPEGTAGISMFVAPKFLAGEDGAPGARNDMQCLKLEEKMGLHGSPTCVMAYGENDACFATLLGEPHKGLRNMFVMMNAARLDVGVQGVGVAEAAFQRALAYALERRQGRAPGEKSGEMIAIYEHPDVRRMLFAMKSYIEASRAICYATAVCADLAAGAPDADARAKAAARESLLTPIAKAWSTDRANDVASLALQVHGGAGYIEETGAAQHLRDARIAAIYEGTNGIQAIDLAGRKLFGDKGAAARAFLQDAHEEAVILKAGKNAALARIGARLDEAVAALSQSTDYMLARGAAGDMDSALAGASDFLAQFGDVAGGYYLARGAMAAALALKEPGADKPYLESRIALARFYAEHVLAPSTGRRAAVEAGADVVPRLYPAALAEGQ